MLKFEVDPGGKAAEQLREAAQKLEDARPLFRSIAGMLEAETEANFAAEGRPSWVPLAASTRAERLKRNQGSSVLKILQDSGILAASISSAYGPDFAQVGAGGAAKDYAAIQQFGGTIERAAHSVKTRLRTDAKGSLVRQATNKNLAVFAKDTHKRPARAGTRWRRTGCRCRPGHTCRSAARRTMRCCSRRRKRRCSTCCSATSWTPPGAEIGPRGRFSYCASPLRESSLRIPLWPA